jgi:oxygen-independent coproporphyrinogen-3 oxidase
MFTRLYIHIPFCRRKCPYCSFFSQEASGNDLDSYAELLCREMLLAAKHAAPQQKIGSIYFGGGTPSLLEPRKIAQLIDQAEQLFGVSAQAEITLEANPGTVDYQRLADFRQAGVTRLSLGIQSFDDRMLVILGRIHTANQTREAFSAARRAGFRNIGIDLIHALPRQTLDMWHADILQALQLGPEHISIYGLTIEEETPFAATYIRENPLLPDEDLAAEMFEAADNLLPAQGYEHYEIANYARDGFRSQHNSGYWKRDGYLGLGPGAHSYLRDTGHGTRFSNTADLRVYATVLQSGTLPRTDMMTLAREDAMAEFLFLGLRMSDGVRFRSFADEFGVGLTEVFAQEIATLLEQGLLTENPSGLCLTRRGMLLSNQVFQKFLP